MDQKEEAHASNASNASNASDDEAGGATDLPVASLRPQVVRPPIEGVDNAALTLRDMKLFIEGAVRYQGLVSHNIDGYNDLIERGIAHILTSQFEADRTVRNERAATPEDRSVKAFQVRFQFHDVKVGRPTCTTYLTGQFMDLHPARARLSGLRYSGPVSLTATVTVRAHHENGRVETKTAEIPRFQLCAFPTMVRGTNCHTANAPLEGLKAMGEDPTDPGGYFIAKRGEYGVDLLENLRFCSPHFHARMKPNEHVRAEFLSKPGDGFENSSQTRVRYMTNGQITVEINSTRFKGVRLPFFVLYRLFGITSDRMVAETIVLDLEDSSPLTQRMLEIVERAFHLADEAFAELVPEINRERLVQLTAERVAKYLTNPSAYLSHEGAVQFLNEDLLGSPSRPGGLDKVLLPHMGQTAAARIPKLRFLGLLIHKMLLVHLGVLPATDRDSYRNKRVHGAGVSLAKAFKTQVNNSIVVPVFRALRRELKNNPWTSVAEKVLIDTVRSALSASDLDRAMEQAITAGNKTIVVRRVASTNRVSSQAVERKNILNAISAGRTVVTHNAGNASKQTERADVMRRVHGTYVGYICVAHSAESGESVGMRKQLACTAGVCTAGETLPLKRRLLADPAITPLDRVSGGDILRRGLACVYINGEWLGACADPYALAARYRRLRREGRAVDPFATIYWDPITSDVEFWLDVGRLRRPLLIVDSNVAAYDAAMRARHVWRQAGELPDDERAPAAKAPAKAPATAFAAATFSLDGERFRVDCALAVCAGRAPEWVSVADLQVGAQTAEEGALLVAEQAGRLTVVLGGARLARAIAASEEFVPALLLAPDELVACRAAAPPPRPVFTQNTRYTTVHARGLATGQLTLRDLVREGVAEYITPEEHENCLVAESIEVLRAQRHDVLSRFTHVDVEQAIFGFAGLMSPFGDHTQPARVTLQTGHSRQTGGWYALNFPWRTDKNRFFQFYNQMPLVSTMTNWFIPPNGANTIIAYMTYLGDNQEDSAIVCKASAERGLFSGAFFRFELAELEKGDSFGTPDPTTTKNMKPAACYEKLVDGVIRVGSIAVMGDILVGRYAKLSRGRATERYQFACRSVTYRLHEPALIEDVLRMRGPNDELFIIVKMRYERPLRTGDKLSSREGNKCLTPDHDVLTADGWQPIAEVRPGTRVACAPAGRLEYLPASAAHQYDVDGAMVAVGGGRVSLCVTPNHRMWARVGGAPPTFHEASTLVGVPAVYDGGLGGDEPAAEEAAVPMHDRLVLMLEAILLGRGRVVGAEIVFVCKGRHSSRLAEDIVAALPGATLANATLRVPMAVIGVTLTPGPRNIPPEAFGLKVGQLRVLLRALADSTGGCCHDPMIWINGCGRFACDIQRLAIHAGWGSVADARRVGIYTDQMRPVVAATVNYRGRVHCLTVPGGRFYVRRRGKAVWTGNSIVARMYTQSDMPFTDSGITPHILINPTSFPSRMAIGQLIETAIGKSCARRGTIADGTSFLPVDNREVGEQLLSLGFRFNGRERMHNGFTGEHFDVAIFIGPTTEQRLQKFVLDDEQAAAGSSPTDATTGQPLGGKNVGAALRLGEMEQWSLNSHGSMFNVYEKIRTDSDGRPMNVCRGCSSLAVYNKFQGIYMCRTCGDRADISVVDSSKSAILLHEELAAANIKMTLGLQPRQFEARAAR